MKKASQDNNFIRISSPFGKDALILNSLEYREGISELFSLRAKAYFNDQKNELNEIVGKEVTISVENSSRVSKSPRFFHGIVSAAKLEGQRVMNSHNGENYKNIEIIVEPKVKFAAYRNNCKIFQKKNIKDIISEVLSEHGVAFKFELKNTYPQYSYKVQYEESDLAFVQRLLAEEGLSFCFSHSKSSHVLDIFDDVSFYKPSPEFMVDFDTGSSESSHISAWNETQVLTTKSSQKSGFNMLKPASQPKNVAAGDTALFTVPASEYFEYLGETESDDQYSLRNTHAIESLQQNVYLCSGEASCRTFSVGKCFKFKKHEDKSRVGKEYVLASVTIFASVFNQTGLGGTASQGVRVAFTCVDSKTILRPAVTYPKPQIKGLQTAIVTGNKDGEVYVDKHGRIKVQFHWDRLGKYDVNSSCWIRVAQSVAGNGWGAVFHPRVGQEVIVEFVNGDPDQPIVTGALYNGSQLPPYSLPEKSSQSGFKSRSVQKGNANFNELRFEDKPGEEHIYLHAEKLFQMLVEDCVDIVVENNKVEKVTNDVTQDVGKNAMLKVGENYTSDTGKVLSLSAGKSIEIKVGGASIQMSSSGEINIKGNKISINGSAIALKAGQISLN
ncbi:type VI secretion system tip protein TssI/VgrG [Vibrio parahaemolyticus]|uniref:type VI secretion system tip protein TssI/VgrG n=5 Tax=Vibrio parahaemolyticus TaxID=670 RepID=UPI00064A8E70|nr:type VI secretion system tip protein TssI/VgrG [Vibrio parahaemolyticus]EJG1472908.1 type VI secretion system tip protein VgrG [Vibrio parahaemolyticus]EKA7405060.1 type VI secretion system tip protein VgrG [Vibrio parahaemolyticus]EKG9657005.1 type VI secretion system tip protein VgrG [Vibrio parahaemolyticus]EKL9846989.1 type VI secretion system tip protein VgrG [Vibrio parahaemolyticus]EKY4889064.1 type VI secretion system tip protein VgrG [Vibrio parahaemolyticus]